MFYSEVNNKEIDKEYLNNIFFNNLIKIKSKINYSIKDLIKYLELEIFKYNKKYNYNIICFNFFYFIQRFINYHFLYFFFLNFFFFYFL